MKVSKTLIILAILAALFGCFEQEQKQEQKPDCKNPRNDQEREICDEAFFKRTVPHAPKKTYSSGQ